MMWLLVTLGSFGHGSFGHALEFGEQQPLTEPLTARTALGPVVEALRGAVASEDVAALQAAQIRYSSLWPSVESTVRVDHRATYVAIEESLGDLTYALQPDSMDIITAFSAARALLAATSPLLVAETPASSSATASATAGEIPTLSSVIAQLHVARSQLATGNFPDARSTLAEARRWWPDVEGAVKPRDAAAYHECEDLLARAAAQLKAGDAQADTTLARLNELLIPFTHASAYGISDAFLIVLREGIEALLVITALLAYLGRSGHANKQRFIWLGATGGVAVSIALAIGIQALFKAAFSGADREVVEGIVGLVAAGLLFWVSWWLHRAACLSRWNASIAERTQSAIATGSLTSLAILAFLAVLREGAETALFFLGMAPSIATGDLVLGLALGGVALAACGVIFATVGARLPLRPFFLALGILILAMGIKFVGAGIHALQIAQWLPSTVIPHLPTITVLGFFPTWESALGQACAILAAVGMMQFGARSMRTSFKTAVETAVETATAPVLTPTRVP